MTAQIEQRARIAAQARIPLGSWNLFHVRLMQTIVSSTRALREFGLRGFAHTPQLKDGFLPVKG